MAGVKDIIFSIYDFLVGNEEKSYVSKFIQKKNISTYSLGFRRLLTKKKIPAHKKKTYFTKYTS